MRGTMGTYDKEIIKFSSVYSTGTWGNFRNIKELKLPVRMSLYPIFL